MIKNDRQYRLTKAQVRQFTDALAGLKQSRPLQNVDPQLVEVQRRAMESQLEEMAGDLKEYEDLKTGNVSVFEAQSLADLPCLLVKARIARGTTQKELAERLDLKEQQIQRWEANDYHGASLESLKSIAEALGVVLRQQLVVPDSELTPTTFLASLKRTGLAPEFVLNRIAPPTTASLFRDKLAGVTEIATTASAVSRIYGLPLVTLLSAKALRFDVSAIAATKFKLPARANRSAVDAYTIYAHYLSAVLVDCLQSRPALDLPKSPHDFYQAVSQPGTPMTFESVIRFLWGCGIIVLPLREDGGFHGADALHENGHIANGHITDDIALIEEKEISRDNDTKKEEEEANDWAENALFGGRSEEIEEACTSACKGRLQNLKTALPAVADKFNVNVGALANYMAYRLAQQGENWWGAAKNLQLNSRCPFSIAREVLLENVNLLHVAHFDRTLLERALTEE
jgi:transcriptional regulator with XRE-family HTH domain